MDPSSDPRAEGTPGTQAHVAPSRGPVGQLAARVRRTIELVRMLAPRELRVRYRQSLLDVAWALIGPVVVLGVYGYILTRSFQVTARCAPYLSSAWTGLVLWTFFATAVGGASYSLLTSADLLSKVYFPREAIPLAVVGATLADLGVGLVTIVVLLLIQGVTLHLVALAALLPLLVLVVWTAAISIMVAVLSAFARDVVHAVQLVLRVGFFATPVMYEADLLPGAFRWTGSLSPVAVAITDLRTTLLCGQWPPMDRLALHLGVGALVLLAAVLYTSSVESRIADVI